MATSPVASAVAPPVSQGEARLRQAVVQASPVPTADTVYVLIQGGAEVMGLPYPAGYVPFAGDVVQVLSISAGATETAMVIAPVAGRSGNRILNAAFTVLGAITSGQPPDHWTHFRNTGPTTVIATGQPVDAYEDPVLTIGGSSTLASDNYVYSAAIPVVEGQQYQLSAVGNVQIADPDVTCSILAMWFASATAVYPNTAASDTQAATVTPNEAVDPDFVITGTVTVPAGVTHMRVSVRVVQGATAVGYVTYWLGTHGYRVA